MQSHQWGSVAPQALLLCWCPIGSRTIAALWINSLKLESDGLEQPLSDTNSTVIVKTSICLQLDYLNVLQILMPLIVFQNICKIGTTMPSFYRSESSKRPSKPCKVTWPFGTVLGLTAESANGSFLEFSAAVLVVIMWYKLWDNFVLRRTISHPIWLVTILLHLHVAERHVPGCIWVTNQHTCITLHL